MTNDVIKRFVRAYNLPISIYKEPYFSYLINLYNKPFDSINKFEMLKNEIEKYGGEEAFLNKYYEIRDKIICDIQEKDSYKKFSTSSPLIERYPFSSNDIYKVPFSGKYFLSIDLSKANFQAFNFFDKSILDSDNYEDFISKYTDSKYMKESKYLRQVIFGALNPKKQIAYEQIIRNEIYEYMKERNFEFIHNVISYLNDEIIFEITEKEYTKEYLDNLNYICEEIKKDTGIDVHGEIFKLECFTTNNFFIKKFIDGKYKLKCIPDLYYPQVYKHFEGLEITDMDMYFYNDGYLCKLMEPIF